MEATPGGVPSSEVVHYRVPEGQDPAAVVTALQRDGWRGILNHADSHELLIVAQDERPMDRDRVRLAIAAASLNFEDDPGGVARPEAVRFADE